MQNMQRRRVVHWPLKESTTDAMISAAVFSKGHHRPMRDDGATPFQRISTA